MIKNRKAIISSVAIIFTLVICAIFVNLTLANSTTSVDEGSAEVAVSSLLGYSNIDLAIINSNDSTLTNDEDKFRIVQIMPSGYDSYANSDTEATAALKSGTSIDDLAETTLYTGTTSLWKYVYDGEYFKLAVFNAYKSESLSQNMADGAVVLTTIVVDELNDMDTSDQELLANADFIYIYADKTTNYTTTDLSEDLYTFLVEYTTVDNHPLVISWKTLGTDTPSSITGNNDDTRMGTFAYKIMTKTCVARYSNVLVVEDDYFYDLFVEASTAERNVTKTSDAEYTIAGFIWNAETSTGSGGSGYISSHTYYKWYTSDALSTFLSGSSKQSVYGARTASAGTTWDFDNASVLVIRDGDTGDTTIFDYLKSNNTSTEESLNIYKYNTSKGAWVAETSAANSVFTGLAYYTANNYAYVPSGANIYVVNSADLLEGVSTGTTFKTMALSGSYFHDVATTSLVGTITVDGTINDGSIILYVVCSDSDGNVTLVADDEGNPISLTVTADMFVDGSYSYAFEYLNFDDAACTYGIAYVNDGLDVSVSDTTSGTDDDDDDADDADDDGDDADDADDDGDDAEEEEEEVDDADARTNATGSTIIGVSGNNIIITPNGGTYNEDYTYSVDVEDYTEFDPDEYDVTTGLVLDTSDKVYAYVQSLWEEFVKTETQKTTTATVIDLSSYDFIFIEGGDYTDEIGITVYNTLNSIVKNDLVFVIASSAANSQQISGSSDGSGSGSSEYITSPMAKDIADVINAGVYRSGSDNKFRVLEIQPEYPIDEELAQENDTMTSFYWSGKTNLSGVTMKGDYYTIPSDVSSGYAKEELQEGDEYYDFDLTKAKIAYALQEYDISYSDIELTQVSTEALVGMTEEIAATYDLIYIGGDISAVNRDVTAMYTTTIYSNLAYTNGLMALGLPTFVMYTHTGQLIELGLQYDTATATYMMAMPIIGETKYSTYFIVENGNDLTTDKYQELLSYLVSNRPIMIGTELSSVYEKINGSDSSGNTLTDSQKLSGYWYNNGVLEKGNYYLDPSSQMYKFITNVYTRYKAGYNNVLWGVDTSSDNLVTVENNDRTWGNTVRLDSNGDYYATVFSTETNNDIFSLVQASAKRSRLTIVSMPVEYQENITSTYLTTQTLTYKFALSNSSETYDYYVVVDKNKNTQFDLEDDGGDYVTSGKITGSEEVTAVVNIVDEDYFGSAYWLIRIVDSDENVIAERTGLCKIVNSTETKAEVSVLQIQTMSEGQNAASWGTTDSLYFDVLSQWAHKILKYNSYANQTQFTTTSPLQYACLGLHETQFGIVEYDMDALDDDWLSNLASVLTDEYDISIDLCVADPTYVDFTTGDNVDDVYECLDLWVEDAETLKNGGTVDVTYNGTKKSLTQSQYATEALTALEYYETAYNDYEVAKAKIDDYFERFIAYLESGCTVEDDKYYLGTVKWDAEQQCNVNGILEGFNSSVSYSDLIELAEYCMENDAYYMVFQPSYSTNTAALSNGDSGLYASQYGTDFIDLFIEFRNANNKKILAYNYYQTCLRRSYGEDFLKEMYTIIILGPSDGFGDYNADLSVKSCEYLLDYVNDGGDLFFFHDTMTPFGDKGAVNLTKAMLDIVGLNRFHVDLTDQSNSYTITTSTIASSISEATPATVDHMESTTLTEDGYTYVKISDSTAYTEIYYYGTLLEDGYLYYPNTYSVTYVQVYEEKTNYDGHKEYINGWELYTETAVTYITTWGSIATTSDGWCRKSASAGETGWYLVDVIEYASDSYGTTTAYYAKVYKTAGSSGCYAIVEGEEAYAGGDVTYGTSTMTTVIYDAEASENSKLSSDVYYLTKYVSNAAALGSLQNSLWINILANTTHDASGNIYYGDAYTTTTNFAKDYVISGLAMNSLYYNKNKNAQSGTLKYIYALQINDTGTAFGWSGNGNVDQSSNSETVKASQLNEGLITMYPFSIGDTLNISGTHQQAYTLDIENDNITVWYTLAGSNNENNAKARSSLYAADPYDAAENYFIYTTAYGSGAITYCGTGHNTVTGSNTKNNDERKLYINVIVNSAAAAKEKPTVKIYDTGTSCTSEMEYDTDLKSSTGKTVYVIETESVTDSVAFDIGIIIPDNVTVNNVKVYFDLDYDDTNLATTNPTYTSGTDELIYDYSTDEDGVAVLKGTGMNLALSMINDYTNNKLTLSSKYFEPYGNYTYIAVAVTYENKYTVYALIKVKIAVKLFELTDAGSTYVLPAEDAIVEEKFNF